VRVVQAVRLSPSRPSPWHERDGRPSDAVSVILAQKLPAIISAGPFRAAVLLAGHAGPARPFSLSPSRSLVSPSGEVRPARPGALSEESDCNERGEFHPVARSDAGSDRPAGIIVPLT